MANTSFSPKVFAKELLRKFDQKNVFMKYANSAYEWELKKAWDSVMVQIAPNLTFTASAITNPGANTFRTGTWPGGVIASEDFAITSENLVINKYTDLILTLKQWLLIELQLVLKT